MKKIFTIIILLNSILADGQSYSYKPLDLDTSCYWVHNFFYYFGTPHYECKAEKITRVEKDTIIGAYKFYKLRTYTSEIRLSTPQSACEYLYMKNDNIQFVREDTITHTVIDNFNQILINFDANVGDTLDMGSGSINPIIDSISINNINGIDRKIMWCHWGIGSSPFASIEGIGTTYNFPPRGYGEWGTPSYELVCFSKNGVKQFPNDISTQCLKKPPIPVNVLDIQLNHLKYNLFNKHLIIESTQYPVTISIRNIFGNSVFVNNITDKSPIDLSNLKNSIYIMSLDNHKEKLIKKILID